MNKDRYNEIMDFIKDHYNLPDGAFFALAEECGIEQEDWIEFYESEE